MIRQLLKEFYLAGSALIMSFLGKTRLYLCWSLLYRKVWHREYKWVPVKDSISIREALEAMRSLVWVRDGKRELFDAVGHPGWVQHCINEVQAGRGQPRGALDCDEFAVWAAASLDIRRNPIVYQQTWCAKKGLALGGHHVCVFQDRAGGNLFHIGNWGYAGPFNSLEELGKQMCDAVDAIPVSWALFTPGLQHVANGARLPEKINYAGLEQTLSIHFNSKEK